MNCGKQIKKLVGHSGCSLLLLETVDGLVVRKQAEKNDYNLRLKKQFTKQRKFKSSIIKTPNVYNADYIDGLFYFDMEYIRAKSLAEYSSSISITEITDLICLLFKSLNKNMVINPAVNRIFSLKIESLEKMLVSNDKIIKALVKLKNFDFKYVFKSPCHGDLTLENILITSNKEIYLIDFLDSFYNSWIIDLAKLLQDLELKWSFRNEEPSVNRDLRLLVAKETLINELLTLENSFDIINTIYHCLLLNILRIYPYAKDSKTIVFLDNALIKVINIIDSLQKEVQL